MTYNLHPLFVHFPIALLFLYSVIKILPFGRWVPKVNWRHLQRVLLCVGVAGAFAAIYTGQVAQSLTESGLQLVNAHIFFGQLSTWLYGILLVGEIIAMINTSAFIGKVHVLWLKKTLLFLEKLICHRIYSRIIALAAIIALSLTGLLGGVMVYGTSADPAAAIVLKLLGITM